MKGREVLPLVDVSVVKDVRKELSVIRDKVNSLLDALDITDKVPSKQPAEQQQQHSSTSKRVLVLVNDNFKTLFVHNAIATMFCCHSRIFTMSILISACSKII